MPTRPHAETHAREGTTIRRRPPERTREVQRTEAPPGINRGGAQSKDATGPVGYPHNARRARGRDAFEINPHLP